MNEWVEFMIPVLVFIVWKSMIYAMLVGMVLTSVSFIIKYAKIPCVAGKPMTGASAVSTERRGPLLQKNMQHIGDKWVMVVKLKGFVFFGSASSVTGPVAKVLMEQEKNGVPAYMRLKFVIFDCAMLDGLDASAAGSVKQLATVDCAKVGCKVFWSGVTPAFAASLKQRGLVPNDNPLFPDMNSALRSVDTRILTFRRNMRAKWCALDPNFARRAALNCEQIMFEPFKDILISETARRGTPWRYVKKVTARRFTDIVWGPGSATCRSSSSTPGGSASTTASP